jgi:XapX domain-containing protein
MKVYLVSLALGVLVGVIYGLFNVRSPAPPVIALLGLAGILMGEQIVPLARQWLTSQPVSTAVVSSHLRSHAFAQLPKQAPDCGMSTVEQECKSPK